MHALLLILLAFQPQDETLEKARTLLEESAAKLKAAPVIHFVYDQTQGWSGSAPRTTRSAISMQGTDRLRWDVKADSYDWLQIFDGKQVWHFDRKKAEYYGARQDRGTLKMRSGENPILLLRLEKEPGKLLDKARDVVVASRKEGSETFDIISWRAKDPWSQADITDFSLWLGADRLPRRFMRSSEWKGNLETRQVEISQIDLAPKLAEDAFVFTPPKDAKERSPFQGTEHGTPDSEEARKANALFIEVHKAFKTSDALAYEMDVQMASTGEDPDPPVKSSITLQRPEFVRQDARSAFGWGSTISDGETIWSVNPEDKNYQKREAYTSVHRNWIRVDPVMHMFFEGSRPEILAGAVDIALSKESLGDETVDVVEYAFRQGDSKAKYRLWVGPDRRPRQMTWESTHKDKTYVSTTRYTKFDLKPEIPKDHFTFKPGPGWIDRTDEKYGASLIAAGKPAPDFEATPASGNPVRLSSFAGSPVLLIFGTFGNQGEDRRAQELHEEFSKKGIKVLAVATRTEGATPNSKKFTFTFLRVKDRATAKAFGVDYFTGGMYLLDAEGKIRCSSYGNDEIRKAADALTPAEK